jgi:lipopolysaccharide biosynthesis regulator YciM
LLEENKRDEATSLLKKAIMIDGSQVRAWLDLGRLALAAENYKEAYSYLSEIPKRDVDWLSEAIPLLEEWADKTDGWEQLEKLLEPYWHKCASSYIAKVNIIARNGDSQYAIDILVAQLQKHPTMRGFKTLLKLYQDNFSDAKKAQESLSHLQSLLDTQIGQRPKYRCNSCGFSGRQLHWLCPACKTWSNVKPIKGLDGE